MLPKYQEARNITPEVIASWRAIYPAGIFKISVDELTGYVRMPTDGEAIRVHDDNDLQAISRFTKAIWLGGDIEIINEDRLMAEIEPQIRKVIKAKSDRALKGLDY